MRWVIAQIMGVGLALERVVLVRPPAAEENDRGGDGVRGQEQRAPALGLADVDALVAAGELEELSRAAEDDVAERHGGGAALEECEVAEEERGGAAVEFEDAVAPLRAAAGEERGEEEQESDRRRRQRPEVDERSGHAHRGELIRNGAARRGRGTGAADEWAFRLRLRGPTTIELPRPLVREAASGGLRGTTWSCS